MWKNIFKTNVAYVLGSAASSLALVVLIPFLVNNLSTEDYGIWSIYELTVTFFSMVLIAGLDSGLMREYWFIKDLNERKKLVSTIFVAIILWSLFIFLLSSIATMLWNNFSSGQYLNNSDFLILFFLSLFESLFLYFLSILRIQEKAYLFSFLSVGKLILLTFFVIYGVNNIGGIYGALIGRLCVSIIMALIAFFLVRKNFSLSFDKKNFVKALKYGLPLLPTNISSYILFALDRYVLQAIYSFSYKISTIFDILINRPFAMDWAPRRFKIEANQDAPKKFANVVLVYLFISIFFVIGVYVVSPLVYDLFAPIEYHVGRSVLLILLLSYVIYGLSYPLNVGIMLRDKTKYLPIVGLVSLVSCLLLTFYLVPLYGMYGAAWACLLSYAIWTFLITYISMKIYHIPYNYSQIIFICATAFVSYMSTSIVDIFSNMLPMSIFMNAVVKAVIVIFFAAVSFYWLFKNNKDLLSAWK
jgi:O-antigen/teichoic acid export membrane protein